MIAQNKRGEMQQKTSLTNNMKTATLCDCCCIVTCHYCFVHTHHRRRVNWGDGSDRPHGQKFVAATPHRRLIPDKFLAAVEWASFCKSAPFYMSKLYSKNMLLYESDNEFQHKIAPKIVWRPGSAQTRWEFTALPRPIAGFRGACEEGREKKGAE